MHSVRDNRIMTAPTALRVALAVALLCAALGPVSGSSTSSTHRKLVSSPTVQLPPPSSPTVQLPSGLEVRLEDYQGYAIVKHGVASLKISKMRKDRPEGAPDNGKVFHASQDSKDSIGTWWLPGLNYPIAIGIKENTMDQDNKYREYRVRKDAPVQENGMCMFTALELHRHGDKHTFTEMVNIDLAAKRKAEEADEARRKADEANRNANEKGQNANKLEEEVDKLEEDVALLVGRED